MTDLTLYHNPRCSKSRGALELLEARGLTPTVVRYLETPLDAAQIQSLLGKLGISARQLLRTGEDEYKTLNLADSSLSEAQLIAAIAAHPKLMERPILEVGDKAIIGRPPEKCWSCCHECTVHSGSVLQPQRLDQRNGPADCPWRRAGRA